MLLVKTSLKYSPIHGLGCFADEDIKQGTVVWKLDHAFDIEMNISEVKKLPASYQDFLKIYAYSPVNGTHETVILCGDHARHMNHSESPNLSEGGEDGELNIASKDISKGDELTCDYKSFDKEASHKLGNY